MEVTQTIEEPGELPTGVDLWMLSPNFRKRPVLRMKAQLSEIVNDMAERSSRDSNLIIWYGISNFAESGFWYPDFDKWIRHGVILSGSGPRTKMGVVFSTSIENRWRGKVIWSETGGARCSETCRWILKKISGDGASKLVCDPYAASPMLAIWCRRLNLMYRGYSRYQGVRRKIEKELAQVCLPGIQEELPLLIDNGE